jgi:hypothetical protein
MQVVARRPIQRGMELSASYVNPSLDPSVRQDSLVCNHNFSCSCPRCVNPQRLDRRTGLWVTASASSRGGGRAIGATGAGNRTVLNPRRIAQMAGATKEEKDDDDDTNRCCSSSSSGGSDIADFVDAFAPGVDDY